MEVPFKPWACMSYIRKGKIKGFRCLIAVMGLMTGMWRQEIYGSTTVKFYKVLCRSVGVTW